jgi:hypothetical protein
MLVLRDYARLRSNLLGKRKISLAFGEQRQCAHLAGIGKR